MCCRRSEGPQVTALLTDEAVIEAARSHAQEETKLMHDSTERDEHLEYAERDFETGARFARDRYEAAMQRERECREKLVEALEAVKASWTNNDPLRAQHILQINDALASAKLLA